MTKRLLYNNRIMLTIVLAVFLSIFIIGGIRKVFANDNIHYEKTFITIEIQPGDTLSSIAEEHAVTDMEYRTYIEEVKEINNLKSETIHAGCYLLVPEYHFIQ